MWACGVTAARYPIKVAGEGSNPFRSTSLGESRLSGRVEGSPMGCGSPQSNLISHGIASIIVVTLMGYRFIGSRERPRASVAVCIFSKNISRRPSQHLCNMIRNHAAGHPHRHRSTSSAFGFLALSSQRPYYTLNSFSCISYRSDQRLGRLHTPS
jgi:hypothetical protein